MYPLAQTFSLSDFCFTKLQLTEVVLEGGKEGVFLRVPPENNTLRIGSRRLLQEISVLRNSLQIPMPFRGEKLF